MQQWEEIKVCVISFLFDQREDLLVVEISS